MLYGVVMFNGRSSKDSGFEIELFPAYTFAEMDIESVHIPGRSGDVITTRGKSFFNVQKPYEVSMGSMVDTLPVMAERLSSWLHSAPGYARLEDTYEPDYYRMACYHESGEIENILNHGGRGTITFDCKPQRFLKSGEAFRKIDSPMIWRNVAGQPATPRIRVRGLQNGNGSIIINSTAIKIVKITDGMILDSELKDAYMGTANLNGDVQLDRYKGYPMLVAGENRVAFDGDIKWLEIQPNWWTV